MPALDTRTVVLGVSGGIAAYKSVELCRRLTDAGARVVPVLTDGATQFVGEVTFSALASEPVQRSLWSEQDPIPHTTLGRRADVVLVAPATARVIGSYAAGISDDLLTATLLATRAPVVVCPAMHTEMWEHPAVRDNLATLTARGVRVVPPAAGRLAGGDEGAGRLADPGDILAAVEAALAPADLAGWRVLVTAGGTREPIDPVRWIGNRSSGRQGEALAAEAAARGAAVTLVTTAERPAPGGLAETVRVCSAEEMRAAVHARAPEQDVIAMAAAVADFRPVAPADRKLKKREGTPRIELEPTPDILAELGATKPQGQILVGFAAETDDVEAHARAKLADKQLDLVVANDVGAPGIGFDHETNAVSIIPPHGEAIQVPLASKRVVAAAVLDAVRALRDP